MNPKILVTGANGFVGSQLIIRLKEDSKSLVVGAVRKETNESIHSGEYCVVGNIDAQTDWRAALRGIDVVVHTAARAHVMKDEENNPLAAYQKINVEGTLNLAMQAARAGIRRFIFISSIKVNGETTPLDQPFIADDIESPQDAYGISKMQAEQGLKQIASETGMEIVIIRSPLVYGPGVKGNFATMINMVEKGLPLPLGGVNNKRSLIAVDNLVDLIITCIEQPAAANQVFLAGDGEDLSTTELLRALARAMGKPSRLISVPAWVLVLGATILGKKAMTQRLLGSLQVDISKTKNVLGWKPLLNVEEGLRRAVDNNRH